MGNGLAAWLTRYGKATIVGLLAFGTIMMVVLALQHVNASRPAAGAEAGPIPTFTSDAAPLVTFVGDSYTAGSMQNSGSNTLYTSLLRRAMDIRVQSVAVGGSGYVNIGETGATFSGQVPAISSDAAVVVVYGSRNDSPATDPADEKRAAADLYAAIKVRAPNAKLVVIGPSYVEDPSPVGGISNAGAIRQAATDAKATYVDALNWFHGTPAAYIGTDHIHPTDAGHKYLETKIAPIVKDALG